jgi:spore germination cell wall hydrolase CwlJ-like protein
MRITPILGGVVSLAVIVAMAGIYKTASEAHAAVNPSEVIEADPAVMQPLRFATREYVEVWSAGVEYASLSTDLVEAEEPIQELSAEELHCLAQNIYFEARGESQLGQEFIAWTTINRMYDERWPDTICDVVWQSKQFSWTHDGKSDTPKDAAAWERAVDIARLVWEDSQESLALDPTEGAIAFVESSTASSWHENLERIVRIDNHTFYR